MDWFDSPLELIGDTPLLRLHRVVPAAAPPVVAKLEYLNPGGSVKDRIALRMVESAETDGSLRAGGTIVEPTSGNTGVGLAIVAARKGYRCIFTCPDKVSEEKRNVLRAYGAEVVVCPAAVPPDHPDSYRSVSSRIARETPGAVKLDQYSNQANAESHYLSTGEEIWKQTRGRLTHLVASVGTGGTISGTGRYLKDVSKGAVQVIGADPDGSVYSGGSGRPYLLEGIGQPSFPASYHPGVADRILAVSDADAIAMTRRLAAEEGLLVGGSSGLAVAAAAAVAADAGRDALIVVVLPDSGRGYISKLFDPSWLARHGLTDPEPGVANAGSALLEPVLIAPSATVAAAADLMRRHRRRHLAVTTAEPPVRLAELRGIVSAARVAEALSRPGGASSVVADITEDVPSAAGAGQRLTDLAPALRRGPLTIMDGGLFRGVLTEEDLLSVLEPPLTTRATGEETQQ